MVDFRDPLDIPPAKEGWSQETLLQFQEILQDLFRQYPVVPCPITKQLNPLAAMIAAERFRREALINLGPAMAAYKATNTGVPNDLIMAAYTLLFL